MNIEWGGSMKRLCLLISALLIGSSVVVAQQDAAASRRAPTVTQVMKFFEVMHVRDQMQVMLQAEQKQLDIMMSDMLSKNLPTATADQKQKFTKLTTDAMNDLMKNYPVDDVLRDMVPVYQAHLTESDLNEVVAFYSSPTGQKLLKEMPAMTQEAMRVSYARMQPAIEKLIKDMQTNVEKMANEDPKRDTAPTSQQR
jgi:hypothetical protein